MVLAAAMLALIPQLVSPLHAQQATEAGAAATFLPRPPADLTAAKAHGTLERYCAGCHQRALAQSRKAASGGLDNILALDEIARAPWLVRPGVPDASRIYNVALTRERHLDILNDPALPEPGASEVQAIRDWIADLPQRAASGCGAGTVPAIGAFGDLMANALAPLSPEAARLTRFVSLAHVAVGNCGEPAVLTALKSRLARGDAGGRNWQPVDPDRLLWRISLSDLGWEAAEWERRLADYPLRAAPGLPVPREVVTATGTAMPVVAADWLAARGAVSDLAVAQLWLQPVGLERIAAELGLAVAGLVRLLRDVPTPLALPARRLLGGDAIERHQADQLTAHLSGLAVPPAPASSEAFQIALLADKPAYKAGDTAAFSVMASRDCYLTLVGIDRAGRATVLFPSELEPHNRITAGQSVLVPAATAPYRFRFKDKGRETFVAICSMTHRAPEGVVHDYDRLRFTVLGDWQLFLREPPEMKEARRDDAATDVPRPQQRRRRARAPDNKSDPAAMLLDQQTRTAIVVEIE